VCFDFFCNLRICTNEVTRGAAGGFDHPQNHQKWVEKKNWFKPSPNGKFLIGIPTLRKTYDSLVCHAFALQLLDGCHRKIAKDVGQPRKRAG
jgi:hypothetical protein